MRWVDTDVDRARWRGTLNYRLLENLQVGAEFNLGVEEVGPLVTWFLRREGDRAPAVFLGTSSDRIGSPEGKQAYYVTFAKHAPDLPVSVYASLNYSEWDEAINVPFGVTVGRQVIVQPMFDGDRTHLLLSWSGTRTSVSLLWIWLERAGLSFAFAF